MYTHNKVVVHLKRWIVVGSVELQGLYGTRKAKAISFRSIGQRHLQTGHVMQ